MAIFMNGVYQLIKGEGLCEIGVCRSRMLLLEI